MIYIFYSIFVFLQIYLISFKFKKKIFKLSFFSKNSVPNIGGFIIFLNIFLFNYFFNFYQNSQILNLCFLLSTIFLLDDIQIISIKRKYELILKIFIQFLFINILIFKTNLFYFDKNIFFYFFYLLLFIFIINSSNFVDGLNGFLGINLFFVFLAILAIQSYQDEIILNKETLTFFILSLIIFLYFNLTNGHIFMGDSGSIPFGLLICFIFLSNIYNENYLLNFFIFTYPLVDVLFTLINRLVKKKNFFARLFDYAIFFPITKFSKSHLYVSKIIFFSNMLSLILLLIYLQLQTQLIPFLNILLNILVFIFFKYRKNY